MAEDISTTSDLLLDCVCTALSTAGRPVCECYTTVGDPMIAICCECDPGVSGEVSIHLDRLYEVDPTTLLSVFRVRPCKRGTVAGDFVIVLTRCWPTVNEAGEIPDTEDQDAGARDLHDDAAIVWNALACCTGLRLLINEISVDAPPQAGCSILTARVTAELIPRPPQAAS